MFSDIFVNLCDLYILQRAFLLADSPPEDHKSTPFDTEYSSLCYKNLVYLFYI